MTYAVLAPTDESPDPARLAHYARTFLDAELSPDLRLESKPVEQCPDVIERANRGVEAIGGAGMDALVARTRRVWFTDSLLVAATLAGTLLGPIVPFDEITIFGVKGARARLHSPL